MMALKSKSPIHSMTGFATQEGEFNGRKVRIEVKSLNHRFVDIKTRLPREFQALDLPLRGAITAKITRGSVDFKLEILPESTGALPEFTANLSLAAHYYESLNSLQKTLGLTDQIRTMDILQFPDVISKKGAETAESASDKDVFVRFEPLLEEAMQKLTQMRAMEGENIRRIVMDVINEIKAHTQTIKSKRTVTLEQMKSRIKDKITNVFEAYPLNDNNTKALLETRIAQELAILVDRTDFEEEIQRLQGHLDHFEKVISDGGAVGRKLDFILQEMGREINTLGNKAQDVGISEHVVQSKTKLEQIREQVMNLE